MTERTEMLVETPITVFEVWKNLLENHPEVVRQTSKVYANHPHGQTADQEITVLPRERIVWSDDALQYYGQPNEIKAIGARVQILPPDFDPRLEYSGAYRFFCDGEALTIDPKNERSFIFFDFESHPSQELLDLTLRSLKRWNMNWYLLDSGGSYHLIIDKLVKPEATPKFYGGLIMDMAENLPTEKSIFYGHIGKYLIENWDNKEKLRLWIDSVYDAFGHADEPLKNGKYIFPIDMRWIAHAVEALIDSNNNEGYLRVSSKYGSVPVLKAQQVDGNVTVFNFSKEPFIRQPALPVF